MEGIFSSLEAAYIPKEVGVQTTSEDWLLNLLDDFDQSTRQKKNNRVKIR